MFKRFLAIFIIVFVTCTAAWGADDPPRELTSAKEIINEMDKLLRGDTASGTYEMTITDPRWTRTLKLLVWEKRLEKKSFIRILSPAKEKGIGTLKIESEMWNYLPRVERTIKIPPSMMMQPWMGSDFTNDDLVKESSIVDDFTHELLGVVDMDGHRAYHIVSRPRPDAPVVWDKIVYWLTVGDYLPLKEEFYSEKGELIRVMTFSEIKEVGGRLIPTYWEMVPVKKKGRMTSMRILDAVYNEPIDDAIFTLRNLKKVR